MASNTAEALRRIHENKHTQSKILDLSGLGLSELPEELWDCVWVEELGLGHNYCWSEEKQEWGLEYRKEEMGNLLSSLPMGISNFNRLTSLFLDANPLSDLNALKPLLKLRSLSLASTNVDDLGALNTLRELSSLDLSFTRVKDLSALSTLLELGSLDLSVTEVEDLSALKHLLKLRNLDLSVTKVEDLSPLSHLLNLSTLYLRSTKVEDLSALSSLVNLSSLYLSYTKVKDLTPLGPLLNLNTLYLNHTKVEDLSPLDSLLNLNALYLRSTKVEDLSVLSPLLNLTELDLSYMSISDLNVLSSLRNLINLKLNESAIPYFPLELLFLPKLEYLNLQATHCLNLPSELTQEDNALPDLQNYYAELQRNAYTSYQVKLITVGNGRVGKTSLLKALFSLGPFNPQEDSTHGIRLFKTTLGLPRENAIASLLLWDFGGQELYHATHRIFMKSRALYLLLWDPHTEQKPGEESVDRQGQTDLFRNFPLSYWLGNIRALSRDAKIIVVCNKADAGQEHFPKELHDLQAQYKIDSFLSVSAKTGYNLPTLHYRIQYLLEKMPEMGMQMPLSWKNVQDKLAAIENQHYINFATYSAICSEENLSEGSMYTLLRFLHHAGFVFWHEQYLQDQIVLNQKWALDAIYTLLNRNSWYKLLKGKGLLQRSALALCWGNYTPDQVQLFLEIMQSCELALEIGDKNDPDPTYLIPEFLPDHPSTAVNYSWEGAVSPIYHFRFQHHFFHAALVQRFIVRSAKLAESYDVLWRTGILLKVEDTLARIQVYPAAGRIDMQLRGAKPGMLIERIKNEIAKIQEVEDKDGFLLSLSGKPDEWVPLDQVYQGSTHVASTSGKVLEFAPFHPLIHTSNLEEETKSWNLKELSDLETGAQLLQTTDVFSLMGFKSSAKTQLAIGIDVILEYLLENLLPTSTSFDELILLQGQWNGLKRQDRAGIIGQNDNQLSENQIRSRILSLINEIQESDVKR